MAIGYQPATNGIDFPTCPYASLPPAAGNDGLAFFCADAPNGATLVVSDGTSWRQFARGFTAQSYVLQTADNGLATFNYALSAPPIPAISLMDTATGAGMLTYAIKTRTAAQLQVQVSRGQVLPALAALVGFNAFTGGVTAGVTVFFIGIPTT